MIVVLSKNSVESDWVREELNAGMVRKIEKTTKLIPIRLDGCEVPECVKHCVWQEIPNLEAYDDEFKRILNSIFGQYEKPPIGDPPPHLRSEAPSMEGLARIDAIVLEAVCRISIESGKTLIDGQVLVERLNLIGIADTEIIESQQVLEGRGLLAILRSMGPPSVHPMKITLLGFDQFAHACISDYTRPRPRRHAPVPLEVSRGYGAYFPQWRLDRLPLQ